MSSTNLIPDVDELLGLFYDDPTQAGTLEAIPPDEIPAPFRALLVHDEHMTVTVEAFHDSPVDVRVLEVKNKSPSYARKIVLTRQSDGQVVQFGIVRLDPRVLPDEVRTQIESQRIPLGRVLIDHQVLREVQLIGTFRVQAGPDMAHCMGLPLGTVLYGRTARILLDGHPAVELLEILGSRALGPIQFPR